VAAGATVLGMAVETIREVEPALPVLQSALQIAPWAVGVLALTGIAYMVWARIDDRRRGLR
jgi:threonine/homoserine/homoserine lactone efflux protein